MTSDTPVDDWRTFVNGLMLGVLTEETSTQAVLDAPEGTHIRIDALFAGQWITACESDVECLPTATPTDTPTPTTTLATPPGTGTPTTTPTAGTPTTTPTAGTPTTTPTAGTPTTTPTAGTPTTTSTAGTPTATPTAVSPTTTPTASTPTATPTAGTPTTTPTAVTPTTTPTASTLTATLAAGTPTATATVPAGTCRIAGTVTMQGRSDHSGITIRIDGLSVTTTAVDGSFATDNVFPGIRRVRASHLGYLSREDNSRQCQAGAVTEMPTTTLVGGDVNNDERVNLFDLVTVGTSFRACAGDEWFRPEADIDETGCVDIFDLVLVGVNYDRTGPVDWSTTILSGRAPGE